MGARMPNIQPAAPLPPVPGTPLPRSSTGGREQEVAALQAQARAIANQLQAIQARIGQGSRRQTAGAMVAVVDPERCVGCGTCEKVCPAAAVSVGQVARVDGTKCTGCGRCVAECPRGAVMLQEV